MDRALLDRMAALHEESFGWALACADRDRRDAEDVLQAVYLKVLEGRARYDGRASLKTWLFAVIRRTASEHRRLALVRRLRLVPLDEGAHEPSSAPAPDEDAEARERGERLARALGRLPRRQREVLVLVFYHGHSVEEAAVVLGIGVGSARTHYARGKERLGKLLGGDL